MAAAKMWTKQPVRMPSPPTMPARAPDRSEFATMYSMSGPGVRFSSQPAAMKASRWGRSGIVSSLGSGDEEGTDRGDRAVHAGGIHVQVRHEAQAVQAGGQDASCLQVLEQRRRARDGLPLQVDEDDVGLRRFHLQRVNTGQPLGQAAGQRVVAGQPLNVVIE